MVDIYRGCLTCYYFGKGRNSSLPNRTLGWPSVLSIKHAAGEQSWASPGFTG